MFIIYDAFIGGLVKGSFGTPGNYIVHYIINISLFYVHALIILPIALKSIIQSIFKLPILLFLELCVYECIIYAVDAFLIKYTNILAIDGLHFDRTFILAYIWRGLYFMLFSTGYYLFRRYKAERDKNEALQQSHFEMHLKKEVIEKKMAQAKIAFLIAQINPHFLFNTLNYIYYTIVKDSPDNAESIMILSKLMRYSSDIENAEETILLVKEAEYVSWLMELYKIRLKQNFIMSFDASPQAKEWKIIPFLLITVAENILKHGLISDPRHPAILTIAQDNEGNLLITSLNKIKKAIDPSGLKSGLANLEERMRIFYDNQASLEYKANLEQNFELRIMIPKTFKT